MELSPLARERLTKIGSLSQEEKERLRQSRDLDLLLSEYFQGKLDTDGLWKRLKALKEQTGDPVVKEAQGKLIDTLRLQMSQEDFEQRRKAILATETIKEEGKYTTLELVLNSIEALRQEYTKLKEQAYEQLKSTIQDQLQTAAQQAIKQGMQIDVEGSVEANIKSSPQWKEFISRHEKNSEQMFNSYIARLRETI